MVNIERPSSMSSLSTTSSANVDVALPAYSNEGYVTDAGGVLSSTSTQTTTTTSTKAMGGAIDGIDHGPQLYVNLKSEKDPDCRTFDEALDIIGFGRMQIGVLLVCGLIIMTVLTETMGMGLIMTAAYCDMELSDARKGIISSVTFIGILVSSQVWGFLADTRGRRRVIVSTMLAANVCTVVSSFSTDFTMFVVARFFTGVFMSASSCVTYAYLGEFNTNKNRSTVIAVACIFAGAAYVYLPLMGYLILPSNWSVFITDMLHYRPWRLLIIVNTAPGFFAALCLSRLPESGKFLLTRGNEKAALDVLRRIHCTNTGRTADTFTVSRLHPEHPTPAVDEKNLEIGALKPSNDGYSCVRQFWRQTVPLFRRPLRRHFLICCFLVFGVFFVSAGIGMWYPEIQNRVAHSPTSKHGRTVCDVLENAIHRHPGANVAANATVTTMASMSMPTTTTMENGVCRDTVAYSTFTDAGILGTYYVAMYVLYALCIRRIGQGVFLVVCLFASAMAGLSLQWVDNPLAVVVLFSSHIVFSGICISMLTGIVVALIPTEYRGMAVSISMMFGRLGSIVGSNLVGVLLENNCSATFLMYSGFILVCGLTSLMLPFRTL